MKKRTKIMCLILPALILSASTVIASPLLREVGATATAVRITNSAITEATGASKVINGAGTAFDVNTTVSGMENPKLDPSGFAGGTININLPEIKPPAPYCVVPPVEPPAVTDVRKEAVDLKFGGDKTIIPDNGNNGCVILPHYLDPLKPEAVESHVTVGDKLIVGDKVVTEGPTTDNGNGCVILPHYWDDTLPIESTFSGYQTVVGEKVVTEGPTIIIDDGNGCIIPPPPPFNPDNWGRPIERPFNPLKPEDISNGGGTIFPPPEPPEPPTVETPNYNDIEQDKALKGISGDDVDITASPVNTQYAYDDDEVQQGKNVRKNIDGSVTVVKKFR